MDTPRLRDGASGSLAISALVKASQDAQNLPGGYGSRHLTEFAAAYLSWADEAIGQLANYFEFIDIEELIHTRQYWALQTSITQIVEPVRMLHLEIQSQSRALNEIAGFLQQKRARWDLHNSTILITDTNLFMEEAVPFYEIDWAAIGDFGNAVLVVPLSVIGELDKHKRNQNFKKAARASLKWLRESLPADPAARYEFVPTRSVEVYVPSGPARPDDVDGQIIDICRQIRILSEQRTVIATRDLTMRLFARSLGEDTVDVPEP